MRRRQLFDLDALLAANGAKLDAKRAAELERIAAELQRIAREKAAQRLADDAFRRQRDAEWAAWCRAEREPAPVLPWRVKSWR